MVDQIQCIDKARIGNKIRNLTPKEMNKVIEKLRKILPLRELLKFVGLGPVLTPTSKNC